MNKLRLKLLFKGNAIRCIGNCIERIQEDHLINLLEKLIKHLLEGNNQTKQIRDIYATCIKTIINKVPDKFAEIICKSILKNCFDGTSSFPPSIIKKKNAFLLPFYFPPSQICFFI